MPLSPAAVWRTTPALVRALDERLGPPLDSYVNGTQTWLAGDDEPPGITLELRLHPVAGYRPPRGLSHYEVWDAVVEALGAGQDAEALTLGTERRALSSVWEGLECFPAYGDEVEPPGLARAATALVTVAPDAAGLVDHDRIGGAWERAPGEVSLISLLLDDLRAGR